MWVVYLWRYINHPLGLFKFCKVIKLLYSNKKLNCETVYFISILTTKLHENNVTLDFKAKIFIQDTEYR